MLSIFTAAEKSDHSKHNIKWSENKSLTISCIKNDDKPQDLYYNTKL